MHGYRHMRGSGAGRILLGLLYPRGIARCGCHRRKYLADCQYYVWRKEAGIYTMNIVLEDCWLIDGREVPATWVSIAALNQAPT